MKKIGLIVNPVAGMGGSVGLKGTDGKMYQRASELGAMPVTQERAGTFLSHIKHQDDLTFLVAPGKMGEDVAQEAGVSFTIISSLTSEVTSADDTKRIAREMVNQDVDLVVFVGGDGTARDIYDAIELKKPALGVPSGVKMFGSVFAVNAMAAAEIVDAFVEGQIRIVERDVLDISEDAYRKGKLDIKLYGYLKVPEVVGLVQSGKEPTYPSGSSEENHAAIARYVIENMDGDVLYLLGAGTTVGAVAEGFGVKKTLLGVDAVYNGKLVGENLNEKGILELLSNYARVKIIVSPVGGNAFIFGRGNQEFSPAVLWSVGKDNIIVIATRDKINSVWCLRVDTKDIAIDNMLKGYIKVVTHDNEEVLMPVN